MQIRRVDSRTQTKLVYIILPDGYRILGSLSFAFPKMFEYNLGAAWYVIFCSTISYRYGAMISNCGRDIAL